MGYRVVFTVEAKKDVETLETIVRKRLHKKLLYVVELGDIRTAAKKLTNHTTGDYRLRIGNLRIIFDLDGNTIVILRIQHRKDVYR